MTAQSATRTLPLAYTLPVSRTSPATSSSVMAEFTIEMLLLWTPDGFSVMMTVTLGFALAIVLFL